MESRRVFFSLLSCFFVVEIQGSSLDVPRAQRTLSLEIPNYKPYSSWVFMGKLSPRIPKEHNKYHGYTVRGTPNYPLRNA